MDKSGAPETTLVVFTLDEQRFGLPLASVERAVRAVAVTPLPQAPEAVLGVVNVEGEVIPTFDPRRRFRLPAREIQLTDQLILARTRRRRVALLVDDVSGVAARPLDEILSPDEILPGLACVEGVVKTPDGLVFIHDLDTFLSLEEEKALDRALEKSPPENS